MPHFEPVALAAAIGLLGHISLCLIVFRRVPVMRDGKLVGIVTHSDLARAPAQKLSEMEPSPPHRTSINEALWHGREETITDVRTPGSRR